ncbi:uncharacterized protein SPPG_04907 [Spizellomyces punctatus DAOM BR117]|uniref:Uncharacterized protein n=1 Tax=Spizellomyces punctatus (strain DAOM BR117) TaxID=645134 RepID=A0A0L0HER1_SPIPD|nr:uncharacterized protein SPPG_04907 [Spizellomyces punctatus DAOM BR117]KNC99516.1 hypothetical protein SPPG_04907 [Spizellomyces punctatus DAOM BR117]|eukprot:XP_016607556.1 hypothetical protein SPPG_04907 [Spizellomyces punctatus DAOM BR117]
MEDYQTIKEPTNSSVTTDMVIEDQDTQPSAANHESAFLLHTTIDVPSQAAHPPSSPIYHCPPQSSLGVAGVPDIVPVQSYESDHEADDSQGDRVSIIIDAAPAFAKGHTETHDSKELPPSYGDSIGRTEPSVEAHPPSYYPPAPRSPVIKFLSFMFFPLYFILYLLPKFTWKYVIVPVAKGLIWGVEWIFKLLGTCIEFVWTWTVVPFWNYIVVPIGNGIGWVLSMGVKGAEIGCNAIWTYVLHPIGRGMAWICRGIWFIVSTILDFIYTWIIHPIYAFIVLLLKGLYNYILAPAGNFIVAIVKALYNYILLPIFRGIGVILGWIWKGIVAVWDGCWYISRVIGEAIVKFVSWVWRGLVGWIFSPLWRLLCFLGRGIRDFILSPIWWCITQIGSGIAFVAGILSEYVIVPIWRGIMAVGSAINAYIIQPIGWAMGQLAREISEIVVGMGKMFSSLW